MNRLTVIAANAEIHQAALDSRLRGNDERVRDDPTCLSLS